MPNSKLTAEIIEVPSISDLLKQLVEQGNQLRQARGYLSALSSGMYEPEIWMEIKTWLKANPTTETPDE